MDWPKKWQELVDRSNPDVVAVELGRWEVSDRIIDGKWTQIGEPAWDRLYAAELAQAIRILSSRGAHVVIFTLPYIMQTTEAPNGEPWDINQPVRTNDYNALVRQVVARSGGRASVIDLNRLLDPGRDLHVVPGRGPGSEPRRRARLGARAGCSCARSILPSLVRLGLPHATARLRATDKVKRTSS